jgi:hypothetical protein
VRRLDRARIARESYEDRGGHGYAGGYTAQELRRMQTILLQDQHNLVRPPHLELIAANLFLLELSDTARHPGRAPVRPPRPESPAALARGLVAR